MFVAGFYGIISFLKQKNAKIKFLASGFLIPLSFCYFFYQGNSVIKEYINLSNRTETKEYIVKENEYNLIKSFLDKKSVGHKEKLKVYINPFFFIIPPCDSYETVRFWGPFLSWEDGYDYVINYKELEASYILKNLNETSASYESYKKSKNLQDEHVGSECKKDPCYKKVISPLTNVNVYEKVMPR